jgi:hypothetical protein
MMSAPNFVEPVTRSPMDLYVSQCPTQVSARYLRAHRYITSHVSATGFNSCLTIETLLCAHSSSVRDLYVQYGSWMIN